MTWQKDWEELVESCARAEENLFRANLPDGTDDIWRNAILSKDDELKGNKCRIKALQQVCEGLEIRLRRMRAWIDAEVDKHDKMKRDAVKLGVMAVYHPCECKMCRTLSRKR